MAAAREGPVRSALRGGGEEPAGDGAGLASLYFRRPAPHHVLRGGLGLHAKDARRVVHHGRGDLGWVPRRAQVRLALALLLGLLAWPAAGGAQNEPQLKVPAGFAIEVFAAKVGSPRFMAVDPAGTLLVSEPAKGRVLALPDKNGRGRADGIQMVVDGLEQPHRPALRGRALYVAEDTRVQRLPYDPGT